MVNLTGGGLVRDHPVPGQAVRVETWPGLEEHKALSWVAIFPVDNLAEIVKDWMSGLRY